MDPIDLAIAIFSSSSVPVIGNDEQKTLFRQTQASLSGRKHSLVALDDSTEKSYLELLGFMMFDLKFWI
jgi:hypothetical protein